MKVSLYFSKSALKISELFKTSLYFTATATHVRRKLDHNKNYVKNESLDLPY